MTIIKYSVSKKKLFLSKEIILEDILKLIIQIHKICILSPYNL